MSIAIITACWQRPKVFSLFLRHYASLDPVAVICAGSPNDGCDEIARTNGIDYIQTPNDPLGAKWNAATIRASQVNATHFLFLGSDDLMDEKMWEYYQAYDGDHLCLLDLYFMELRTRQVCYWPGYQNHRAGEPIGAAKLVSRAVLDALGWQPFDPWRNKVLDSGFYMRIRELGCNMDVVSMEETGGVCVDIKGDSSITPWRRVMAQPGIVNKRRGWFNKKFPNLTQ